MSWKEVEGSRRRNFRVMFVDSELGVVDEGAEGSLVKKRRPSCDGCVRAERRDEMWWRTGAEDSFCVVGVGLVEGLEASGVVV
jgi:hypothetical protein